MSNSRLAWIGAVEAARLLRVSRATLYAYVSRGLIRSQPSPGAPRERLYAHDDLLRLRRQAEERRAPDKAAARALEWGMPILESAITLIDGRRLYYRGLDVADLARARSLEEIAALIWTGSFEGVAAGDEGERKGESLQPVVGAAFVTRAQILLATAAARDPSAMDLRTAAVARTGRRIVRLLTRAATRRPLDDAAAVHSALAAEWNVGASGVDVVRAALILCADHELNVSSFTARCVASAGSQPYAVVSAALAALEGPRHGGASARAESMLHAMRRSRPLGATLAARLRRGESIHGFGHPLYPEGDPRAAVLFELLGERYAKSAECRFVTDFAQAATDMIGEPPNVDFALAAVSRVLHLPAHVPLTLFAVGRSVGWIGHAIEQYATGQLIRPRAKYVGHPAQPPEPAR